MWIEAADGLNTLIDYRYQQHFKADTGGHGMGKNRHGANGGDVVLKVPVGTEVLGDRKVLPSLWLVPLRDVVAMGVWVAGFAGNTVVWRGERFKLKGGRLEKASESAGQRVSKSA